jgi:hypothetical protein
MAVDCVLDQGLEEALEGIGRTFQTISTKLKQRLNTSVASLRSESITSGPHPYTANFQPSPHDPLAFGKRLTYPRFRICPALAARKLVYSLWTSNEQQSYFQGYITE